MTAKQLKDRICSVVDDVVFTYNGKPACINPFSIHKFEVGYSDMVKTYTNIDDLMRDPIYDGKSLNDIADQLLF